MKNKFLILVLLFTTVSGFAETPFKCRLKGHVTNRNSKAIYLFKASDKPGPLTAPLATIAINNGTFEYTFDVNVTEAYELIFKDELDNNVFNSILFFPVNGEVVFQLYPQTENSKNTINGGKLNADYTVFRQLEAENFDARRKSIYDKMHLLQNNHDYYSPIHDSLIKAMNRVSHDKVDPSVYRKLTEIQKDGTEFTVHGHEIKQELDAVEKDAIKWRYQYIGSHVDVFSYYLMLYNEMFLSGSSSIETSAIREVFPKFAAKYPNHPYTAIIGNYLASLNKVKIGQPLIDFTLPDIAGRTHSLSTLAKGKITLIDFWGSWCGPCISATRTMIPVYDQFKNKGFTIVGVAREYQTTKTLKATIKREKYQWINLVELNNSQDLWNKYGIINGNGFMVLVDQEGKIIALDPTAEEVKKILSFSL